MFGECHGHIMMDGRNYREAVCRHRDRPDESWVRACLEAYRQAGVSFFRDGGDKMGVSVLAKTLAPEYGIDYRTPVFAIYKKGHYGSIVGRAFEDMREYHKRVLQAASAGADFIKIMTTGLLDFQNGGDITGEPLSRDEVFEMVHIAHEEGLAVMSHTNGDYGVRAAVEAGVDSLEHGNYMNDETVTILAESDTVWVPTLVTVRNLYGCGRYNDRVLAAVIDRAADALRQAYDKGAALALGSDAGAYRVFHGTGIVQEYRAFAEIIGGSDELFERLRQGEKIIRQKFVSDKAAYVGGRFHMAEKADK